jgi:hypothetical protein
MDGTATTIEDGGENQSAISECNLLSIREGLEKHMGSNFVESVTSLRFDEHAYAIEQR